MIICHLMLNVLHMIFQQKLHEYGMQLHSRTLWRPSPKRTICTMSYQRNHNCRLMWTMSYFSSLESISAFSSWCLFIISSAPWTSLASSSDDSWVHISVAHFNYSAVKHIVGEKSTSTVYVSFIFFNTIIIYATIMLWNNKAVVTTIYTQIVQYTSIYVNWQSR